MPTDDVVVETAAQAAEDTVFSAFDRSELADLDISVQFTDGTLTVDVYIDPREDMHRADDVADDAAAAAQAAVDELFAEES